MNVAIGLFAEVCVGKNQTKKWGKKATKNK